MEKREMIFISHATPTDNEFAAWLATKLELCGYRVWVDIKSLGPASDFWHEIEDAIRNKAIRFIFVATKASSNPKRDGVQKELAVADKIRRQLDGFIIPVRADDVNFDSFPLEVLRLNAIDFNGRWGEGLAQLLEHLEKEQIIRASQLPNADYVIERWRSINSTDQNRLLNITEEYTSNLFCAELPQHVYAYADMRTEHQFSQRHIPYKKTNGYCVALACPKCVTAMIGNTFEYHSIDINNLMMSGSQPLPNGTLIYVNQLIDLLNWNIQEFFYQKGLFKYRSASSTKTVYYYPNGVKSKRGDAGRSIHLAGKYREKTWHYAISAYFTRYPENGFIIRPHLVFLDENRKVLPDASQISARRSRGRLMYNMQWRDLMNASMYYLAAGSDHICYNCCCDESVIHIKREGMAFETNIGYDEGRREVLTADEE